MKRVLFILGGVLLVCALALLVFPELRMNIFGVNLDMKLQKGRVEAVSCVSMLMNAREIRNLSSDKNLNMDEDVQPDVYDLSVGMLERAEITGDQPVVNYQIKEENLAQVGVNKKKNFLNNIFSLRLDKHGLPAGMELLKGQFSSIVDTARFTQLLAPMWIARPSKNIGTGEVWNGRYKLEYPISALGGKRVFLEHRVKYCINSIRIENDMDIAEIAYSGEISFAPLDKLPENTEAECKGRIEGTALFNLKLGSVILADDRTTWVSAVRFLDDDLEELSLFDRRSRIFRPKYVPNAAGGFSSAMPEGGEVPDLNQVDNSSKPAADKK